MEEKIVEFFENIKIEKKYILKDYGLSDPLTGYFLFSITIGGSTGGSCYGSYTQEYREDNQSILNELASKVEYEINYLSYYLRNKSNFKEIITKYIDETCFASDYIDTLSEGYDYYGNYIKKGLFKVSIKDIFEKVVDEQKLDELLSLLNSYNNDESIYFSQIKKENRIKELELSINNFSKNKNKEKKDIENDINSLKKQLDFYIKKLENFEKNKKQEEEDMKNELNELKNEKIKEQKFYKENVLHREDGPAVISSNGDKMWYYEGMLHRQDGPAIELTNGHKEWYIFDEPYTKEEFELINKKSKKHKV